MTATTLQAALPGSPPDNRRGRRQRPPTRTRRPAADTSATTPADTSATLPLDFSAGAGAGTPPPPPPPPPPYYGATPPPAGSQPLNFFDWIRSQGIRRGRERWVGGVASGIAERFGVDPLIVRGILIVLTVFAGVGVLLYGIAWALLPEPDGRIHVQEAAAGRWSVRDDRGPDHHGHRLPQPGRRCLGLGPLRLRRLHLDRLLGGWRHLPHLLPDPAQQVPERSPLPCPRAPSPAARPAPDYPAERRQRRQRHGPSPPPATAPRMRCPATASQRCPARSGARPRRRVHPSPRRRLPAGAGRRTRPAGQTPELRPRRPRRRGHRRSRPAGGRRHQGPRRRERDRSRHLQQRRRLGQRRGGPGPGHPHRRPQGPHLRHPRILRRGRPDRRRHLQRRSPTATASARRTPTGHR